MNSQAFALASVSFFSSTSTQKEGTKETINGIKMGHQDIELRLSEIIMAKGDL